MTPIKSEESFEALQNWLEMPLGGALLQQELRMVEKVFDDKSDIVYSLNNVFESQNSSNHITTVSEPISDGGDKYHFLVDMEAHEICSVIGGLDHLNNLFIIKIISDYMDVSKKYFNSKKVKDLVEINLLQIDTMLKELRNHQ